MTKPVRMPPAGVYFFVQWVIAVLVRILTQHHSQGIENIPREGAFILVSNHLSASDPPVIYINCPRQMVMFGADTWRRVPVVAQICDLVGVIWVTRGEADMHAIKATLAHLRAGGGLGMAPEGTRSRSGVLQKGKTGAAYLADRARVPIVPVAVWGTENVVNSLKRLRRAQVHCSIGAPFRLPTQGRAKLEELEASTDHIMCQIAALLPPEYRGAYADHPLLHELLAAPST